MLRTCSVPRGGGKGGGEGEGGGGEGAGDGGAHVGTPMMYWLVPTTGQ